MKTIKINESQKNRLFEAYQEGFSLQDLTAIADSAFSGEDNSVPQMSYCTKWLGQPTFMGSSRAVYTLTDALVLKLAYGNKYQAGIDQNRREFQVYQAVDSPLLPKIYYHDKNFTYLVCENVVPATEVDFEKLLGIPFYDRYEQESYGGRDSESQYGGDHEIGFDKYFDDIKPRDKREHLVNMFTIIEYLDSNYVIGDITVDNKIEQAIKENPWLTDLKKLIQKTKITDLGTVNNFGMVNRDGKPMIVVLDSGFNMEIFLKHYIR